MGGRAYCQPHFADASFKKQCPSTKEGAPTQRCRNKAACDRVGKEDLRLRRDEMIEQLHKAHPEATQTARENQAREVARSSCCLKCTQGGRDAEVARIIIQSLPPMRSRTDRLHNTDPVKAPQLVDLQAGMQPQQVHDFTVGVTNEPFGKPRAAASQRVPSPMRLIQTPVPQQSHISELDALQTPHAPPKPRSFGDIHKEESPFSDDNPFQSKRRTTIKKPLAPRLNLDGTFEDTRIKNESDAFSEENPFQRSKRVVETPSASLNKNDIRDHIKQERDVVRDVLASGRPIRLSRRSPPSPQSTNDTTHSSSATSLSSAASFSTARSDLADDQHLKDATIAELREQLATQAAEHGRLRARCETAEAVAKKYERKYKTLLGSVRVFRRMVDGVEEENEGDEQLGRGLIYEKKYGGLLRLFRVFVAQVGLPEEEGLMPQA